MVKSGLAQPIVAGTSDGVPPKEPGLRVIKSAGLLSCVSRCKPVLQTESVTKPALAGGLPSLGLESDFDYNS